MKVIEILVNNTGSGVSMTMEQFVGSGLATTLLGQLLVALAAETVWSDEYGVYADFAGCEKYKPLRIYHPNFLGDWPLVIYEEPDATVDSVKEAVLAHIGAQLKDLQKQSTALQLKSASLNDAQGHILRTTAVRSMVAKRPEADGCRLFAPYGGSDFTCFTQGAGFGHTLFVARGDCPEYSGGIVQLNMPGDEWLHLERRKQHERFWAELAMSFAACGLKIQKDDLYWQKTFVIEVDCTYHANEVQLRRRSVNEQIVVTFDVDSLPVKAVRVPDNESVEV